MSGSLCSIAASEPLQCLCEEIVTNAGPQPALPAQCCVVLSTQQMSVWLKPLHLLGHEVCRTSLPTAVKDFSLLPQGLALYFQKKPQPQNSGFSVPVCKYVLSGPD